MIFPKYCKDCKYSEPERDSNWNLRCMHPIVNSEDAYALSGSVAIRGSSCSMERGKKSIWYSKCGMKGRLWESK